MAAASSPLHFVFSATQNGVGGGLTVWKALLAEPPEDVTLHYSSFAAPLWTDFHRQRLSQQIHRNWRTYENRGYAQYDDSNRDFDFTRIPHGSRVVLDAVEGMRQLAKELIDRSCSVFLHVQSAERLIRRGPLSSAGNQMRDVIRMCRLRKLIYVGEFVKRHLHGHFPGSLFLRGVDSAVIHTGIECNGSEVDGRDPRTVYYFGRYEKLKNPLFLRQLEAPAKFVGTNRGCSHPVEIPPDLDLGWMPPQQAAELGNIFVFPSVGEAFSVALLEMMSYGKIVIAFRSGGFPEVIEHGRNGYLIEPFDAAAANRIIGDVLANPAKARAIQEAARRCVVERFSLRSYRERFFQALAT